MRPPTNQCGVTSSSASTHSLRPSRPTTVRSPSIDDCCQISSGISIMKSVAVCTRADFASRRQTTSTKASGGPASNRIGTANPEPSELNRCCPGGSDTVNDPPSTAVSWVVPSRRGAVFSPPGCCGGG